MEQDSPLPDGVDHKTPLDMAQVRMEMVRMPPTAVFEQVFLHRSIILQSGTKRTDQWIGMVNDTKWIDQAAEFVIFQALAHTTGKA